MMASIRNNMARARPMPLAPVGRGISKKSKKNPDGSEMTKAQKKKEKKKAKGSSIKRPPSAWMLFNKEQNKLLRGEGSSFREAIAAVSAKWKGMDDDQKAPYVEQAEELQEEYVAAKEKEAEAAAPKRPMNAYMLYLASARPRLSETLNHKEIVSVASQEWKDMPDKDKKPFVDEATKLKEKYVKDLAAWTEANKPPEEDM